MYYEANVMQEEVDNMNRQYREETEAENLKYLQMRALLANRISKQQAAVATVLERLRILEADLENLSRDDERWNQAYGQVARVHEKMGTAFIGLHDTLINVLHDSVRNK